MSDTAGFLVVFDLDGTLIDSARDLADAGNALVAGYGVPPLPQARIVGMVGDGARELVRRLLAAARSTCRWTRRSHGFCASTTIA